MLYNFDAQGGGVDFLGGLPGEEVNGLAAGVTDVEIAALPGLPGEAGATLDQAGAYP